MIQLVQRHIYFGSEKCARIQILRLDVTRWLFSLIFFSSSVCSLHVFSDCVICMSFPWCWYFLFGKSTVFFLYFIRPRCTFAFHSNKTVGKTKQMIELNKVKRRRKKNADSVAEEVNKIPTIILMYAIWFGAGIFNELNDLLQVFYPIWTILFGIQRATF